MIQSFKNRLLSTEEMYLGKKKVVIKKLTPAKWKELFRTIDTLPGLIVQVMTTKQDFYMTVIHAIDIAMDEIVKVVSVLTDIDEEYINNNVGLDEIVEFVTKTVEINRLDKTVKNIKSLLPKNQ